MPPPTQAHRPPVKSAAADPSGCSVNNPIKAWVSDSPTTAAVQHSTKNINVAKAPVEALRATPSVALGVKVTSVILFPFNYSHQGRRRNTLEQPFVVRKVGYGLRYCLGSLGNYSALFPSEAVNWTAETKWVHRQNRFPAPGNE